MVRVKHKWSWYRRPLIYDNINTGTIYENINGPPDHLHKAELACLPSNFSKSTTPSKIKFFETESKYLIGKSCFVVHEACGYRSTSYLAIRIRYSVNG